MKVKGVVGKIVVQPPSSQQASPAVTNGKPAMSTAKIVELPDEPVQTPKQPPASSSQTPKPILKKTTASTPEPPKPVQEAVVERQTPPARTPPAAGPSQKKAAIGETVIERAPPAVAEVVRERGAPVPSKPLISEIVKEWNAPLTETVKERSSPMSETVKERSIPANGVAAEKRRAEPSVSPPSALPKIAPKTEELVPDLTEPKHTLQVSGVSPSRIIEIKIELPGMVSILKDPPRVSHFSLTISLDYACQCGTRLVPGLDRA